MRGNRFRHALARRTARTAARGDPPVAGVPAGRPRRGPACAVAALALVAGLAAAPAPAATAAGAPGTTAARVSPAAIDRFVTDHLERTGLPGAAVAVTRGDRVVHTAGYGHASTGAPLTADTPMRIASLSKSFTALAVMRLVDRGEVRLDRPVREHVPGFRLADPRGADITVRQLLDQTSGMSDRTFDDATRPVQPATPKEAVAQLRTAGLAGAPGTKWRYHNPNYHVAARLVEVVSGEPFNRYLERHVFAPAGMAATTAVTSTADPVPGLARGHIRAYGANVPMPEPARFTAGSGGVVSTANDMARWLVVQGNDGVAADGTRVLSAESVRETHTPSAPNGRYALGWMRREPDAADTATAPQVWHGGLVSTYSAYQVLVPSTGYGVAVLFNSGMSLTEEDTWRLVDGIVALTEGRVPPPADSRLWLVDTMFGVLTVVVAALGVRGVLRARAWAARRSGRSRWWDVPRLVPYLLPPALLAAFQPLVTFVMGGRDGTWTQRFYAIPAELTFLATAALACLAVLTAPARG